ncbi:hypothetical protein SLS54_008917 [Diplodia seriata]
MQSAQLIDRFLEKYEKKEQEYYEKLANHVSALCETFLHKAEIKANVTHRAKAMGRLKDKLQGRGKTYESENQIRADIVDLSGVRIALFFPSEKVDVNRIIEDEFDIVEKVKHPKPDGGQAQTSKGKGPRKVSFRDGQDGETIVEYDRRFEGYQATHFWARLGEKHGSRGFNESDKVEIQVMTVLQSAWSEVEHDILYKHLNGNPSELEQQMLDGLNGLVSIGELYLSHLSTMNKDKTKPFANEFELGEFLCSKIGKSRGADEFTVSSAELLRKFLGLSCVQADSKVSLEEELSNIRINTDLTSSLQTPYSEKPNASLVVMERIYYSESKKLSEKARRIQPSSTREMCRVLFSTVISLDELFSPISFWEKELLNNEWQAPRATQIEALRNLRWLMDTQNPRNVVLGDVKELDQREQERLRRLWRWFETHQSKFVQFALGISKLGVVREFQRDMEKLNRIFPALQSFR